MKLVLYLVPNTAIEVCTGVEEETLKAGPALEHTQSAAPADFSPRINN